MAEIIFNCQFVETQFSTKKNNNVKQVNTNDMIKYYDRKEACDYTQEKFNNDDDYSIDTNKAFNYYNYRIGSTGGFNNNGNLKINEANNLINKYKPKSIYRMVFSFEEEFLQKNGFLQKNQIQKLITKSMNKNIRLMGLNPDNCVWGAYYHTNTAHPHVHIWLFEKNPTKQYYRIPKSTFKKMRSNVIRTMNINSEIYANRDLAKKELLDTLEKLGLNKMFYKSQKIDKKTFTDKKITDMFMKLEKIIPKTGSLKFNSKNISPYKKQINELIDYILSNKLVKEYYDTYIKLLEKEKQMYNNRYYSDEEKMSKNKFVDNKEKELRDRIGNMILQSIKNYREDCLDYENENNSQNNDENRFSEKLLARNSIKNRSAILNAGILDELSKAIDISARTNAVIENELNQMINKAKKEISNQKNNITL
ncbi:hypothetical protein B5E92_11555 [Erysipelatoclostridium sp. An15]|uniref:relaxase MobL n=1 Tax=Erysipelatoclostridium sp. An15 TaxID=1965566 RepID=UPI000B3822A7|nr:relaxase MobL [Erysipelatoclostridium sp. An15]OUQ06068.1 hypothetical protein B5E92_11555 [Erysipelatoclostridium sp. An15]